MVQGGLSFVVAAYLITGVGLIGLAAIIVARLAYWSARAKELDKK